MSDICSKCGGYTECIIGWYYQCPKCEKGSKDTITSTNNIIVWVHGGSPSPLPAGHKQSFWATKKGGSNSSNVFSFEPYRVIGKASKEEFDSKPINQVFYLVAETDLTFEAM